MSLLTQPNLSADERERIAYIQGRPMLAGLFTELGELEARIDGLEDVGIHEARDVKEILEARDDAIAAQEAAEERAEKVAEALDTALDAVRALLEDDAFKFGKRARLRLSLALRDVQLAKIPNDAILRTIEESVEA